MRRLFADTLSWFALFVPTDEWHERAGSFDLADVALVTTEEVLSEFLPDRKVEVVIQSHQSFLAGLALYERRPDKQYSLVDCISMNVMRQRNIREILTHDRHFSQEGFARLLDRRA